LPQWTPAEITERLLTWTGEHGRVPTVKDWTLAKHHTPSANLVQRRFGSWNAAIDAAGLTPNLPHGWTRDRVIRAMWDWEKAHGRQPSARQWKTRGDGRPQYDTVVRLFGSWNAAVAKAGFPPLRPGGRRQAA
jgi:hypothetical protein